MGNVIVTEAATLIEIGKGVEIAIPTDHLGRAARHRIGPDVEMTDLVTVLFVRVRQTGVTGHLGNCATVMMLARRNMQLHLSGRL